MDNEIYTQLLRRTLRTGDELLLLAGADSKLVRFTGFGEIWHGRLGNPGCVPGKYIDRNTAILEDGSRVATSDLTFKDAVLLEKRTQELPVNWHLIDINEDVVTADLPPAAFYEGDVVTLVDRSHSDYRVGETAKNQYTVYRVDFATASSNNVSYRLRAGPRLINATETQLQLAAYGPIRIFYTDETAQLHWRSLKDEAEFYLLLGRYARLFNDEAFSYKWDLATSRKQVLSGNADGILKVKDFYHLVKFQDREIGSQVACSPELILDI